MANVIQITPFMHVPDLEAAVAFFRDVLGFDVLLHSEGYAYVELEGAGIRMMQNVGDDGAPPGNRRFAYYLDVRDVDAMFARLKPALERLPPRDVFGPVDQSYGQREFMVLAPDGNLVVFGQAISGAREDHAAD